MWPESGEQPKKLRTGLTTGSCATACCVAAARYLLGPANTDEDDNEYSVEITLPKGKVVSMTICSHELHDGESVASTIKDAGDDPDVTHGAKVSVALKLTTDPGIKFYAGEGVGTATREGLALAIGEPAINPVPRIMMTDHLEAIADEFHYQGGFSVTVAVEDGENLALKTMNPRLGILGGLSILGTSGIVRPFSCAAYIASIHQGIDVARANGIKHIGASTGNQSEAAIREKYLLSDMALIEMGDFVGAVLKYLKKAPVERLSLCGGFGKISKLAKGHLDLHSRASSIDFSFLAELAAEAGANQALREKILKSNTSIEALNHCQKVQIDLAKLVCKQAAQQVRKIIPSGIELDLWVVNRQGEIVGSML
jgi:cobalt-precorrin-5B (C1)-methyltransferase